MMHGRFLHRWSNDLIMSHDVDQPTKWLIQGELSAIGIIFRVVDEIVRLKERLSYMLATFVACVI